MSDFHVGKGFEDVWRFGKTRWLAEPDARGSTAPLSPEAKARLRRVVRRAPEVVVAMRGAARTRRQLQSHLDYLTRGGRLELESSTNHEVLRGRRDVRDLVEDWVWGAQTEQARRHPDAPISRSFVLSMPAGIDAHVLRKAARQFGEVAFGAFDQVSVLHEDTPHPHIHLTVRTLGRRGEHLNPKRSDLDRWRELFAEVLRANGVEAEATRRADRGVTLKGERHQLRKMRELYEQGRIQRPVTLTEAYKHAAAAILGEREAPLDWEAKLRRRQRSPRFTPPKPRRWIDRLIQTTGSCRVKSVHSSPRCQRWRPAAFAWPANCKTPTAKNRPGAKSIGCGNLSLTARGTARQGIPRPPTDSF